MYAEIIKAEIKYRTSRSGGKGGQHVNKVETRVEAVLDLENSVGLSEEEKELIFEKLKNIISSEGLLAVADQTSRSQLKNKEIAAGKLLLLLEEALIVPKKRKKLRLPASVKAKRAEDKKRNSEKKAGRKKPGLFDFT